MKTTKLTLILILLFATGSVTNVSAQSWLKRLGERAEDAAKRRVERKVEEKVDKAVDNAFDKTEESVNQKKKKNEPVTEETPGNVQQKQRKTRKTVNENLEIIEEEIPDVDSSVPTTPMQNATEWDTGEPFYALKKGGKIQYTIYDGKGKVQGYTNQRIIELTRKAKSVNAVIAGTYTDSKGKEKEAGTVSLRYNNGNFYVDVLSVMPPKGLEGAKIDARVKGSDMVIPEKLAPGQSLPDAKVTFEMSMGGGGEVMDMPPITIRVFNRKAVGAESVTTPAGKFVCFKITQSVEMNIPIIGKQVSSSIVWIGKGVGTVKSEEYDKKGKLTSRMLLTQLE